MLVAPGLLKARLWTGFFCFDHEKIRIIRCSTVAAFICFLILKLVKFGE